MYWKNMDKLLRAITLMSAPQGATISSLGEQLGISRRSVYRLFETMEAMSFPIFEATESDGHTKVWRIEEHFAKKLPNLAVPEIRFTGQELMLLHALLNSSHSFKGLYQTSRIEALKEKLNCFSPEMNRQLSKLDTIFANFKGPGKDYTGQEEKIETITDAILRQRRCSVSYFAFHTETTKTYEIDPLYLFEKDGGLYLFVRIPKHDSIRTLAVERIRELEPTEKEFTFPEEFDPQEKLDGAFNLTFGDPIEAEVWFSAAEARYIKERRWAKNQRIIDNDDGSLVLWLETSGTRDLKRWILSFGPDAMVVSPESLAEEIRADLKHLSSIYTPEGSRDAARRTTATDSDPEERNDETS